MAASERAEHPEDNHEIDVFDWLLEILWVLPPERQAAFWEYLDEKGQAEADDGGDPAEGGREER
jgi:hypothetical protein